MKPLQKRIIPFICGLLIVGSCASLKAKEQPIQSIIFKDGWVYFMSPNGENIAQHRLANLRSIVFDSSSAEDIDNVELSDSAIRLYPNPATEIITIETEETPSFKIYDLSGNCLVRGEGSQINVSSLAPGQYFVQVNNQILKFIKK